MSFLRNTFAVLIGLGIAALVITLGIRMNPKWITFENFAPFESWSKFLESRQRDDQFFWFLLFISGLGTTIGGIVTALLVKFAKVAYAILIGFIMLFFAMLDIIVFPYHPTFYKILIFLTFFPFSWIGGKVVEIIYERKKKKRISSKMNK